MRDSEHRIAVTPALSRGLAIAAVSCTLVGCETAEYEDCTTTEDPAATSGSRVDKCKPATFVITNPRFMEVSGVAWRNGEPAPGALLHVAPWDGFPSDRGATTSVVADVGGAFGPIADVSHRWDLNANLGGDVLVIRGIAGRGFAPSLELGGPGVERSWRAAIDVQLDPAPPSDHAIALFANGDQTVGLDGDFEQGAFVRTTHFGARATIHAIEYVRGSDLASAVSYGNVELMVDAGQRRLARIRLEPVANRPETKLNATAPPGFTSAGADVYLVFSRSSFAKLTTMQFGVPTRLPTFPTAVFTAYRIRATNADGVVIETGEKGMDTFAKETNVDLPPGVPIAETPLEGASIGADELLQARAEGVIEHVLVPEGGGPEIHVITKQRQARLPNFASVNAPTPSGRYRWSVRTYPKLRFVEDLQGRDARRYQNVIVSPPRLVTFR